MPVYEIKSARGGLSDYEDKGITGSFKFAYNLDIRKQVDSISCGQALVDEGLDSTSSPSASPSPSSSPSLSPSSSISASPSATSSPSASPSPSASASPSGSVSPSSSISPSPSPTAGLGTIFNDLIIAFVKCSNGYTYAFGNTGYIYRRDSDAFWDIVYKDPDGEINGAAEWYGDNGRKIYLYWATKNGTLKRKDIDGLSNWNDVHTVGSNLNHDVPHTMREAGGSLIICNGSFMALVGYDDSYTNEALDLIPGNIANTIVERSGRSIIGTYRQSDGIGVNAAIDSEYPLAQIGNNGELCFANMSDSMPIKRFPGGGVVKPGAVANESSSSVFFEWEQTALSWIDKQEVGNLALFGVYNASLNKNGIYTYGRKNKNHPVVMNLEYQLEVDEIGALVNIEGILLVSYRDGTEFGVKAVDPDNKATGVYEGLDLKAPVKKPINITEWKYVELFMAPIPDGSSVQFWYRTDKTGNFIQAKTADGLNEFRYANAKEAVFRIGAKGDIFEPRLVLTPIGNLSPEVYKMNIHFS